MSTARPDNRGLSSISDGDLGRTRTRNALVSTAAWNGAGLGTVITVTVGSVAAFRLGDGIVMLNFRDPVGPARAPVSRPRSPATTAAAPSQLPIS